MKTTVRMEGFKDLDKAMGQLSKAMAKGVAQRVLIKAGTPMQKAAEARAPKRSSDAPVETYKSGGVQRVRRPGTLQATVNIGTKLTKNQARQNRKVRTALAEVHIGTRDPIARLVEDGTKDTPPHPFMRPAWEGHKDEALEIIKTQLGVEIDKAAQRLAKRLARKGG